MKSPKFNPDVNEFVDMFKKLKSVKAIADYYNKTPCVIYSYIKRNNINLDQWKERRSCRRFNPGKEDFIKTYDKVKSSRKMGEIFGVEKSTILNYAKEIGYVNHYRPELNEEQIQYICSQYYLKSAKEVANELNVSESLISKVWADNNFRGKINRVYYCNEHYFESIDTPGKAYLLGLIASDGCVYKRENHIGMLCFGFNKQEIELLNIVKRELNTKQPLLCYGDTIGLAINSETIFNDLKQYNIVPRKTWIYEPVDLQNDELTWHYLRGYLDGDGSIYYSGDKELLSSWEICYCGNQNTMNYISDFLDSQNIIHTLYQDKRDRYADKFYCIRISTICEMKDMIDNLYLNSEGIRGRKYEYALEFLRLYNNKNSKKVGEQNEERYCLCM